MKLIFDQNNSLISNVKPRFNKFFSSLLALIYPIVSNFFAVLLSLPFIYILIFVSMANGSKFNDDSPFIRLFLMGLSFIGIIVFYFLVVKFIDKNPISTLGLKFTKKTLTEYAIGFFIGIIMISATIIIIYITDDYEITFTGFSNFSLLLFIATILMWIIQGASEEIMMRGYTLPMIGKVINVPIGVFVSSIYFALLHLENNSVSSLALVNLFLSGVFFSLYALYSKNLWGACAIHSAWNFAQGNLFGVPVSGINNIGTSIFSTGYNEASYINGGAFGPEGGLAVTFVLCISIIVIMFMFFYRKKSSNLTL